MGVFHWYSVCSLWVVAACGSSTWRLSLNMTTHEWHWSEFQKFFQDVYYVMSAFWLSCFQRAPRTVRSAPPADAPRAWTVSIKPRIQPCTAVLNVEVSNRPAMEPNNVCNPGSRLSVKNVFPKYGDSHVKDKTVAKPWKSVLGFSNLAPG